MPVHPTKDDRLEVAVLQGSVPAMQAYADRVITQRGMRYGLLHLIPQTPTGPDEDRHPSDNADE